MKSVFAAISLTLVSACTFAAEPITTVADICVAPVIPPVSTSEVGLQRVVKAINAWDACIAKHDTATHQQVDAEVKEKVEAWISATAQYSNANARSNAQGAQTEFEKYEARLTFAEREQFKNKLRAVILERPSGVVEAGRTQVPQEAKRDTL